MGDDRQTDSASMPVALAFRGSMRRLATTIAIVTTGTQGRWAGMAATAVTSVTTDPPTILVAANRQASMMPLVETEGRFCVNLLSERHRSLVPIFSGGRSGMERFGFGDWRACERGLPVLADAVSALICRTASVMDVGTHRLLIGKVEHVTNHAAIDPLLWIDGGFASAQRLDAAPDEDSR